MARTKRKRGFAVFKIILLTVCAALLIGAIGVIFLLESPEKDLFAPLPTEPTSAPKVTEAREDPQDLLEKLVDVLTPSVQFQDAVAGPAQTDEMTFGIDVARYQGTIDWETVAAAGVDFAMVRVGYRTLVDGEITPDPNAKFNMQEAQKYGIKLGAYFFSTAVTRAEAIQEAKWVADYIAQYPITYPVAYNCEGFNDPENRQYTLNKTERTDIALVFLKTIEELGYEGMFYASKNEMENDARWEVSRIDPEYKIWVAQYPEEPYPATPRSSYTGKHHMWQYTRSGIVDGIEQSVDVNIAYFGYEGTSDAQDDTPAETVEADVEAMMRFEPAGDTVTAKNETNLRDIPSQGEEATVLYRLKNGETAKRIGISSSGWSKLEYNGETVYAVSSYLTTDLGEPEPDPTEAHDGIETEFRKVDEQVTAKEWVNVRSLPSVTDGEIVGKLENGTLVRRTGISDNGWSRLEMEGKTVYAVSSYLTADHSGDTPEKPEEGIQTVFREVNEQVTAKEAVNLRTLPSVTETGSEVVHQLKNGEVVTRTGINNDVGWSRVVYEGQTLYCVSSYLKPAE